MNYEGKTRYSGPVTDQVGAGAAPGGRGHSVTPRERGAGPAQHGGKAWGRCGRGGREQAEAHSETGGDMQDRDIKT